VSIGTLVAARTGFFFGWWVVFVAATVVFLTGGTFFYGFSVLFNPIVDEFGWSRASVSLGFSLRTEVGGLAAPLVGFLVDRMGSRRLMVFGVATVAVGFVLLSRVETLWGFYASVIVIAIGMSAAAGPVGIVAVAHWFRRMRGRALAVMAMGAGSSGVMVLVLTLLVSAFDWRNALLIVAALQVVICLPLATTMRNRPGDMGLLPDGDVDDGPSLAPGVAGAGPVLPDGMGVRQALRNADFWRLALAVGLTNLGAMAIIVHQIPFLTGSVGLSGGAAAAAASGMILISIPGRFGFGFLADQVDKRFVMGAASALLAFSVLLFATIREPWQAFLVMPLFGIGWGGVIPVRPALQAEVFGLRAFGAIQGLVFTIATLGGLGGPVFAGWMFDQSDSYRLAFAILAGCSLAAAPLIITLRPARWRVVA
jgi:sugar phosphate permease